MPLNKTVHQSFVKKKQIPKKHIRCIHTLNVYLQFSTRNRSIFIIIHKKTVRTSRLSERSDPTSLEVSIRNSTVPHHQFLFGNICVRMCISNITTYVCIYAIHGVHMCT